LRHNRPCMNRHPYPVRPLLALLVLCGLSACGQSESAPLARIELERVLAAPLVLPSPDTKGGTWLGAQSDETVHFADAAGQPLLSFGCDTRDGMTHMRIRRHVAVEPERTALMALIGNGRISRLKVHAVSDGQGPYWEAATPADAETLDVFQGAGIVEVTVPGAGTLTATRSDLPRQLLAACRARVQPTAPDLPG